jgi:pyruvate/2-oxoglutarate dehydrogenase complex dihydrolipoamide acyltransferase (E2) component
MSRPHHSDPPSRVHSPIFTYFAVVGSVLIALLFVAGATLEKGSPVVVTSDRGLPKPWHPDPIQTLATAPAPAPDMTSEAVLAAQPKSAAEVPAVRARAEATPPKKKRVTPKQPPNDYRQNQAWSRDRDHAPFGNDRFFGRF